MEDEYINLLRLFHEQGVEYVVIGGYAVAAHGFPRYTDDLDVLLDATPANAQRVLEVMYRLGYVHGEVEEADFTVQPSFVSISLNGRKVDLMTQVLGVTFAECRHEAPAITTNGLPVRFVNLAALRRNKAATGRPKDLDDLENLPPVADPPPPPQPGSALPWPGL